MLVAPDFIVNRFFIVIFYIKLYRSAVCLFISSVSLVGLLSSAELTQITAGINKLYTLQTNH